ncbi:MAG: hypothetical protein WDO14_24560 [Bacteroidota bacterium]
MKSTVFIRIIVIVLFGVMTFSGLLAQPTVSGPTTICILQGQPYEVGVYSFNAGSPGPGITITFDHWDTKPDPGVPTTNNSGLPNGCTVSSCAFTTADYFWTSPGTNGGFATVRAFYSINGSSSLDVIEYPVQVAYKVTNVYTVGGGGMSCNGTGVNVTLSDSDVGVTYKLISTDASHFEAGSVSGTGGSITFVGVTHDGVYKVVASTSTFCATLEMTSTATVGVTVLTPIHFKVGGGGTFCHGDTARIALSGSQTGITYRLTLNGTNTGQSKVGDGGPIKFEVTYNSGTYGITGEYSSLPCSVASPEHMLGTVSIVYNANPGPFAGATFGYCSADLGGRMTLSGSESNVSYQLYKIGVPWGNAIPGTGSALEWTHLTEGGPYAIIETDTTSGCTTLVTAGWIDSIEPLIRTLSPTNLTVCDGEHPVTLSFSGVSTTSYQLLWQDTPVGDPITDTATPAWTGITTPGVYTVQGTTSVYGLTCSAMMDGSWTVEAGPSLDIDAIEYPCTYHFAPDLTKPKNCIATSLLWNFGDGTTSTTAQLFHTFIPGTDTVTLSISCACNQTVCPVVAKKVITVDGDFTYKDSTIQVSSDKRDSIINTTATTFSDAWPLPYEEQSLSELNPFVSGQRGVWRAEGQYVYRASRRQSSPVKTDKDGTFKMDVFNWQQASLQADSAWVKATTITNYSQYSYELENKDVLGLYSGALYDYGGHLISAEGTNMRNSEMAFTSFEELDGHTSGNWTFGNQPTQNVKVYKVWSGIGNLAIVEAAPEELSGVVSADVIAYNTNPQVILWTYLGPQFNVIPKDVIVCSTAYTDSLHNYTAVVFEDAPFKGIWDGYILLRTTKTPSVTAVLDKTVKHTGNSSLKVTSSQRFPQKALQLGLNTYLVSAWVSVNNPNVTELPIRDGLNLKLYFKNGSGTPINVINTYYESSEIEYYPSGPIIEGWQRVFGTFSTIAPVTFLDIEFNGNGTAWFDDLRIQPTKGLMKGYVYDLKDYRLNAILDENNYATLFYYDAEGNLVLTKKETERGRKTISENITYMREKH